MHRICRDAPLLTKLAEIKLGEAGERLPAGSCSSGAKEITVREDAPGNLRYAVLQTAIDLDWRPSALRPISCRVLRVAPDADNWSEYPNVWGEVEGLMYGCQWFKVYDIIEALHAEFVKRDRSYGRADAAQFAEALNEFFIEEGIGWQLISSTVKSSRAEPKPLKPLVTPRQRRRWKPRSGRRQRNTFAKQWKTSPADRPSGFTRCRLSCNGVARMCRP